MLATKSVPRKSSMVKYKELLELVDHKRYITDDMYRMDVCHAVNDTDYFPFEETLYEVMMAFSRDKRIRDNSTFQIHSQVTAENGEIIPPSCVQPFHGLVMYAAPLCYVYQEPFIVYSVFTHMYAKFWCKLNVIRSEQDTLLRLCNTFEGLVQSYVFENWKNNLPLVRHIPQIVFELNRVNTMLMNNIY